MSTCKEHVIDYPHLCLVTDPVARVAQLLRHTPLWPVVIVECKQTNRVAGIVTERDLAMKVVAVGRDPESTRAEEVMTRMSRMIRADDHLQTAHEMMTELQILRIPVVDHTDRFIGMLARIDTAHTPYPLPPAPSIDTGEQSSCKQAQCEMER